VLSSCVDALGVAPAVGMLLSANDGPRTSSPTRPTRRACSLPPGTSCAGSLIERQHLFQSRGAARVYSSCVHQHVVGAWLLKSDTSDCAAPVQLIGNR
jgi:hypothetical protein